jgi:hypothetical protein
LLPGIARIRRSMSWPSWTQKIPTWWLNHQNPVRDLEVMNILPLMLDRENNM